LIMPLPVLKPEQIIKALEKLGFKRHRQKGSHLIMVKEKMQCQPVIPMHNKDMKKGTLRAIIRQVGLTVEEFLKLLE